MAERPVEELYQQDEEDPEQLPSPVREIAVMFAVTPSPPDSPVVRYFKYLEMTVAPPVYSSNNTPAKNRELDSEMTGPTEVNQPLEVSPRTETPQVTYNNQSMIEIQEDLEDSVIVDNVEDNAARKPTEKQEISTVLKSLYDKKKLGTLTKLDHSILAELSKVVQESPMKHYSKKKTYLGLMYN